MVKSTGERMLLYLSGSDDPIAAAGDAHDIAAQWIEALARRRGGAAVPVES